MRHLFVGVWNLSGGLGCIRTSVLAAPPPPQLALPVSRFYHLCLLPVHLWNSPSNTNKPSVLQDSLPLSLVTTAAWNGLPPPPSRTAGPPTYSIPQKSSGSGFSVSLLQTRLLRKYAEESQVFVLGGGANRPDNHSL